LSGCCTGGWTTSQAPRAHDAQGRGEGRLGPDSFCDTVEHLLGMPHVTVERWEAVRDAVDLHRRGLDFADAVHWACSRGCERFLTFGDRRLARRARRLGLAPEIVLAR